MQREALSLHTTLLDPNQPLADGLTLVRKLCHHGLVLDVRAIHGMLSKWVRFREDDLAGAMAELLTMGHVDLDLPFHTERPIEETATLLTRALRDWPMDAVQVLVDAGATLPTLRVSGTWRDAEAKRALLADAGRAPGEPDLAEFLTLGHDEITAPRIARLLGADGLAVAGVELGAPVDDVLALGLEDMRAYGYVRGRTAYDPSATDPYLRTPSQAKHELHIWLDDDGATKAAYRAFFDSSSDRDDTMQALKERYTQALGKPRGRKNVSWKADGQKLSVSLDKEKSQHMVVLVLEKP